MLKIFIFCLGADREEDGYTFAYEIGDGGSSKVYIGYKNKNKDDKYALKDVRYDYAFDERVKIYNMVSHPNIVKYYQHLSYANTVVVMELCKHNLSQKHNTTN